MWRAVGEFLLVYRKQRLHWDAVDVERHNGPSGKTVATVEAGEAKRVDVLEKHAAALGLSIVDVLRSVLDSSGSPLSPEAELIVRTYERTTVEGRAALLSLARALPDAPAVGEPLAHRPPRRGPHR